MKKIFLKAKRDFTVRKHHPWIFSGAIEPKSEADCATLPPGETVAVCAANGETLGYGSYSPASQIRVRLLSFDAKRQPDAAFIEETLARAVARRAPFFAPESPTTACRLINAENDGLPGVVADCYDGWVVCQLTSAGAAYWKETLAAALMKYVPQCKGVAERTDIDVRAKEGLPVDEQYALHVLVGAEPPELIQIREGAIRYFVDVRHGHKTGFYLDQRDARSAVGELAKGRSVLNCFCYTGGFGLAAAAGGATEVTQVDVSHEALALAARNAELTRDALGSTASGSEGAGSLGSVSSGLPGAISHVEADVFQYLRTCRDAGKKFDLIVLDPPKFAATKAQVMKAARGYKDINLLAMKLLTPGGILATFSCSGAMTTELFDSVLREAALDAGRDFQMLARTRQGLDHPVSLSFPEGLYLKGVILQEMLAT